MIAPTDFPVGETFLISSPAGPGGLTTVVDSGGNFSEGSKHALSDNGAAVVFTTRSDAGELSGGTVVDRQGVNGPDVMLGDLTLRRLTVASTYGPAFGSADHAALPETCPVGSPCSARTVSRRIRRRCSSRSCPASDAA